MWIQDTERFTQINYCDGQIRKYFDTSRTFCTQLPQIWPPSYITRPLWPNFFS